MPFNGRQIPIWRIFGINDILRAGIAKDVLPRIDHDLFADLRKEAEKVWEYVQWRRRVLPHTCEREKHMEELERRRRSMARRATTVRPRTDYPGYRAPDVDWNASADDSWKDWIIIAMGVLVRDMWLHCGYCDLREAFVTAGTRSRSLTHDVDANATRKDTPRCSRKFGGR